MALLFSDGLLIIYPIDLLTPILQFPILAFIHLLALLVILPNILFLEPVHTQKGRIAIALILSGGIALVIGFLSVPRTLIAAETGLMIAIGFWFLKEEFNRQNLESGQSTRLGFEGLLLTALTGIILGLTLARPTIDPIPFQGIEIHGLLGLAFTLSALRVSFSRERKKGNRKGGSDHFLYNTSILVLFSIPIIKQDWTARLVALILLFISLQGIRPPQTGKIVLGMIGGAIVIFSTTSLLSGSEAVLPFFLLAWLYVLCSQIFLIKTGKIFGYLGFLIILSGLMEKNMKLIVIGAGLHVISFITILIHLYKQSRINQRPEWPPPREISESSGTDSSHASIS